MMSSVENFLYHSYPRFVSTTTTTTASVLKHKLLWLCVPQYMRLR